MAVGAGVDDGSGVLLGTALAVGLAVEVCVGSAVAVAVSIGCAWQAHIRIRVSAKNAL